MKENMELERQDIAIDSDMEVDCDIGRQITCYVETWFDVDKKFGTDTASDDDKWLNLYAKYNPYEDTLRLEYTVTTADTYETGEYEPTENESKLIKDMIAEKIREEYHQTPQEFCEEFYNTDDLRNEHTQDGETLTMGGM